MRIGYVTQFRLRPTDLLMEELAKHAEVFEFAAVKDKEDLAVILPYGVKRQFRGIVFPDKSLEDWLETIRPDVVIADEFYQPSTHIARKYCKKNGKPLVVNIRRNNTTGLAERVFLNFAADVAFNVVYEAKKVVCLCDEGLIWFYKYFPEAKKKNKTVIIPNGVDQEKYKDGNGETIRGALGIPLDAPLILGVVRAHEDKGIDYTIKVFNKVSEEMPEARLLLAGIDSIGLQNVGVFTHRFPNHRMKDVYAAADVVLATPRKEPFGYSTLEAQAAGKPVVAFDVGGLSSIVASDTGDFDTGFIEPFGDVESVAADVVLLLKNDELRREMGRHAVDRVTLMFNIRDCAQKVMAVCEEAANGG